MGDFILLAIYIMAGIGTASGILYRIKEDGEYKDKPQSAKFFAAIGMGIVWPLYLAGIIASGD